MFGWKPEDFERNSFYDLQQAVIGYFEEEKRKKEIVRWQCYYSIVSHQKKGFKVSDIWLPGDEYQSKRRGKPGIKKLLDRDALKDTYNKSGFDISEDELDRIMDIRKQKK